MANISREKAYLACVVTALVLGCADHLRAEVAKLREEVERLIEAEELLIFIYRLRQNRASRHHRPHKPPSGPRGEVPVASATDPLASQPVRRRSVPYRFERIRSMMHE